MAKGIIDNYRDLPLGKYEEIVKLCETDMTDVDRKVAIIAVLTGLTEDEVLRLPLDQFTEYSAKSRFIEKECPPNLIPPIAKSYPYGGLDLVPAKDIRKITAAQFIDFQTFSADRANKVPELLSCLLVPKGMDYNEGYDILEVHQAIRDEMPVAEALALLAFFFNGWMQSLRSTLSSSGRMARRIRNPEVRKEMTMRIKELLHSVTAGVGSRM